jgi:hypothetical protein
MHWAMSQTMRMMPTITPMMNLAISGSSQLDAVATRPVLQQANAVPLQDVQGLGRTVRKRASLTDELKGRLLLVSVGVTAEDARS